MEVADYLLRHGARLEAQDRNGSTALHFAAFHGKDRMIRFLLSKGANKLKKNYLNVPPINMYSNRFENKEIANILSVDKEEETKAPTLHHMGVLPKLDEEHKAESTLPDFRDFSIPEASEQLTFDHDLASGYLQTKMSSEEIPLIKANEGSSMFDQS